MKISGTASDTGEEMSVKVADFSIDELNRLSGSVLSAGELKAKIENLPISADAKVLLFQFSRQVVRIGEKVIKIGQKVLETILDIIKAYPHTSFGVVFGAVAGALVGAIPIIGWVLGPVVTPLFILFGMSLGAVMDIADKAVERRIKASIAQYEPLRG